MVKTKDGEIRVPWNMVKNAPLSRNTAWDYSASKKLTSIVLSHRNLRFLYYGPGVILTNTYGLQGFIQSSLWHALSSLFLTCFTPIIPNFFVISTTWLHLPSMLSVAKLHLFLESSQRLSLSLGDSSFFFHKSLCFPYITFITSMLHDLSTSSRLQASWGQGSCLSCSSLCH